MSSVKDLDQLRSTFPGLKHFFDAVADTTYPNMERMPLLNAMVRVVNSQMLSTASASAIFKRIETLARQRRLKYLSNLSAEEFRACGMSKGKIRSIHEFRQRYQKDRNRYERWRELPFDELQAEVDSIWGISTWTAEMLAMFYFGHKDVFPSKDLAINRGVELIRRHIDDGFEPNEGSPYRTLLARCIWRSIEIGYWREFE
ncbi:MAG: hypothetical protein OXG15_00820 [Gammaproteobacteria bacterium]|nr:hypothetical protein [Gammaproteobacteria bacterium]